MARFYKYRKIYKRMYPRKRWATNIKTHENIITVGPQGNSGLESYVICENSSTGSVPTPTILKFGRFKIKGDIRTTAANAANVTTANIYVIFVPEGISNGAGLITSHPEYILGWTTISMDTGNAFSLTSSLKRNLNSGDQIQVCVTIDTTQRPQSDVNFNIYYTVQYWTTSA